MECFVCFGTKNVLRVCKCNMGVHVECLRKVVERVPSHNGRCAVCKERYPCVVARSVNECQVRQPLLCLLYGSVLVACGMYLWLIFVLKELWFTVFILSLYAMLFCLLIPLAHYRLYRQTGYVCCCALVTVPRWSIPQTTTRPAATLTLATAV